MKTDFCPCKDAVFAKAIRIYSQAGMLNDALRLFNEIPGFNCINWTNSFNTLLQILVDAGDLEGAYRLYTENSNCWEVKMQSCSFNLLISALCKVGRPRLAVGVFEEMCWQLCFPDRETYLILMRGLCDAGDLETATHLLYSMFWRISQKGSGSDIVVYRVLLEALCDCGRVEEANMLLNKILKKGLKTPKCHYRNLDIVSEFEKGRSVDDIKRVINEALVKGSVPNSASYSAMIVDLYVEGKIAEGTSVFNKMRERGFSPSIQIYEAKIRAFLEKGEANAALEVLEEEMVEGNCVPGENIYQLVIEGLCKEGKSERGVECLKKMARQVACVAGKGIYEVLVDGLCKEGKFIIASQVMDFMVDRKHWPSANIFNNVVGGLCRMGRTYQAVLWLEEMLSQGKTPEASVWELLVAAVYHSSLDV